MPAYCLFLTIDHRMDCTKAKVQYTSRGDTTVFYAVEDPEFLSPRSAFNELVHAIEEHQAVIKASRQLNEIVNPDG